MRRVYDLSFVSKDVSNSGAPEIIISIQPEHVTQFKVGIGEYATRYSENAERYLGEMPNFVSPTNCRFGYRGCGEVREGRTLDIAFPLYDFDGRHVAYTLMVTFEELRTFFPATRTAELPSEKSQYVDVSLPCRQAVHGHNPSGWILPHFGMWLRAKGGEPREQGTVRRKVTQAIFEVWNALVHRRQKQGTQRAVLLIGDNGHFVLHCPGDACDLGVYPDLVREGMGTRPVRFESHNVESYVQGLALLSGLAALATIAREENEHVHQH
ncbi:MAG TPA: hypothetical protein VFS75_01845 [Candidatus Paceibacterota bacterium]|nr:hypothetical protein [Candidatus Paceibacterota bacterium]